VKCLKFPTVTVLFPQINAERSGWSTVVMINLLLDHEIKSLSIELHDVVRVSFDDFLSHPLVAVISENLPRG
jgi:hypothetical protein